MIGRESHALGDLIHTAESEAVLMTYFRNNILHLFAIPSLIACAFTNSRQVTEAELIRITGLSYPYVRAELRMHWAPEQCEDLARAAIQSLINLNVLIRGADGQTLESPAGGTPQSFQLQQLGQAMVPMLQRYYMTIALLARYGQGAVTQVELERVCELCAERLSIMYGLRSPDFFDRRLFRNFIRGLRRQQVVTADAEGRLNFAEGLHQVQVDARLLLGEQIHHSILDVTAVDPGALGGDE